jgi:thiosulfate/3-mercaptopyruvate sulfurtransferase
VSGSPLISLAELRARADAPALLDVRWALGDPHGHAHYLAGHIPTAVYVDLEHELSAPASAEGGRHPLPDPAGLEAAARRWGVRRGGATVVYDDNAGMSAARAWWLLRWAGVEDVTMLDGGLRAWTASGRALATGETTAAAPGDVVLHAGALAVVGIDDAAELARRGLLLDARAGERYRGEVEPVDPRAGHIPGAVSAPTSENVGADSRFLDAAALRARFESLGAAPGTAIGVYCGSGVSATHEIAALALAGYHAALFPGSWSAWSADPARPAAAGAERG